MGLPARRLLGFALRFGLIWGGLVAAWPWIAPLYRPFYCGLGNLAFGTGEAAAHYRPLDPPERFDVEIRLVKRSTGVRGRMQSDSRVTGYLPTVSLVALVLATPLPWRRRRRALLWGLLLVTLFVALRMAIPLWREFSNPNALQVHHLGPLARRALGILQRSLLQAPASWFVVPVLIWIGVAFRREDRALVLAPRPADDEGPPS